MNNIQRFAHLDGLLAKVNALRKLQSASEDELSVLMAMVNALRVVLSTSGEELSALMPSILDKAFKGEL